jgi:predicted ribosome quality control (RQC) complex YloA/Tae2 family protein
VLLSAHLERGRIQRIETLPARGVDRDTPFTLLIRKHLRNARITALRQPRLERVFELDCEQRDPPNGLYRVTLIVEAMGRRSNLVLVDERRVVLDAARRTPPSRNARRPLLPHLPYAPPPPQDRLFPEAITPEALAEAATGSLAKHLAGRVAGLSPVSGREVAYRATGSLEAETASTRWDAVSPIVREFVSNQVWYPTVAYDGERAVEYAPYELTHLAAMGLRVQHFTSISAAMSVYFAAERRPARGDPLAAERKALLAALERALRSAERRAAALEHQLATAQTEQAPLREAGELILTHQSELVPDATELEVDGRHVALDPELSPAENAQAYFARYRKAREAVERVPQLLSDAQHTVDYLRELRTLVDVADQMDAIRALRREVGVATGAAQRDRKQPSSKARPYRRLALDGWEVLVGSSAEGNAAVTFDLARPEDLWLHARAVPGAHVILRGAPLPPEEVIVRAAELAAAHSASRDAGAVEVDVAPRRYVKKIPGGPPGLVRYANERTLRVTPRTP